MQKTKIDWADMTWNPVTGCFHGCEYCYARRIAERFGLDFAPRLGDPGMEGACKYDSPEGMDTMLELKKPYRINGHIQPYPMAFMPTFHRYRLGEPARKTKGMTIFVCSMADLFGDWVPDSWIADVFKACEAAPQHRYLFLTKNPKRYEQVLDRFFPPNMFFGWSQTGPMGNALNHSTHHSIRSFVSIEPLHRPFERFNVRGLDWAIVGAETGNRRGKVIPEKSWVDAIAIACAANGVPLFMKESLRGLMGPDFVQEFPWEVTPHD